MAANAPKSRPRGPGFVYSVIALVVLVVVGVLALSAAQPPPPSIAEFAPQAVDRIDDAPDEQQSTSGKGTALGPDGKPLETPAPTPAPAEAGGIQVPRVKKCVGNPPRQIEDPQSPPCVPYWEGNNGGATYKGVTGDEIVIAYPTGGFGEDDASVAVLIKFFNARFQFYGRKITLKPFTPTGGTFANPDSAAMKSDAVGVDEQLKAFASMAIPDRKGAEHHYYEELARRKIVSSAYRISSQLTEENLRKTAPYIWNVLPGADTMLRTYGEFLCSTLNGKPARYAGPGSQGQRKFGIVYTRTTDGSVLDLQPMRNSLSACGLKPIEVESSQDGSSTRTGTNQILQLKDDKVTSVVCLCDLGETRGVLMPAASSQAYFPEWLVGTYVDQDLDNTFSQAPPDQRRSVLGLIFRNKLLPREEMPWYWAVREADPTHEVGGGNYYPLASRYAQLLLLASGIQMAGPKLTPESFQSGLQRAAFANPGAGAAPFFQSEVSFKGRLSATGDAAMFWYDPTSPATVVPGDAGRVCYVNRGARYKAGSWPKGDQPFFQGPCI